MASCITIKYKLAFDEPTAADTLTIPVIDNDLVKALETAQSESNALLTKWKDSHGANELVKERQAERDYKEEQIRLKSAQIVENGVESSEDSELDEGAEEMI